jgi:hypothetical protein
MQRAGGGSHAGSATEVVDADLQRLLAKVERWRILYRRWLIGVYAPMYILMLVLMALVVLRYR